MELIKITKNEKGEQLVSARELHRFLEVKKDFSNWIKTYVKNSNYGLIEGVDYTTYKANSTRSVPRPRIEYILKLDTAKELAMLSNVPKGKEVRQYFIECEKQLNKNKLPISYKDALLELVATIEEKEKLEARGNLMMLQREDSSFRHIKVVLADNKALEEELDDTQKELGILNNYYTVSRAQKQFKGNFKWQELKSNSIALGYEIKKVPCPRYGEANAYHSDVWGHVYGLDL